MALGRDAIIGVGADTRPLVQDINRALQTIQGSQLTKLNVRNISEPLGRISGLASEFEKSLEAANARVLAFGASAGILFQLVRAFKETVSATVQVEKSLKDINVILNASETQLNRFGNQLFKIAANTGQTFDTVAQAAAELSRQGLTLQETQKRVQDALILSRLSGLDALNAVQSLTAALNTFNQVGLDSTAVINKLANVDAAFAVSSADLAEAIKRTGNTAQDAGVSFDQLLGIVSAVQERTARGGSVIGNALRTIFVRTQRPQTLDDLEELGVNVRNAANQTLPLLPILQQLADRFGTLSDAQQSNIVQQVAGVRQGEILRALLADLSSGYSDVARGADIAAASTDQANKRNEELNKTLSAQTNRLLANLTKVGSKVGSLTLGPSLQAGLGGLNSILELDQNTNQFAQFGLEAGEALLEGLGKTIRGPGLALFAVFFKNIAIDFTRFLGTAVGEISKLNDRSRTQEALQRNIAQVLSTQPGLLSSIAQGERTVESVAKETLNLYKAQQVVLSQINTISASIAKNTIAGAGGAGAFSRQSVRRGNPTLNVLGAANRNPKIFRSLSGAINNEIKGGVPRTAIRLNSSRALSTPRNPTGLAVTNVRDEPAGLRSIGIPNFVDPFVTTKGTTGGQLKLNSAELKQLTASLNTLEREGTKLTDVFSNLRESVRSKKGSTSVFDDLIAESQIKAREQGRAITNTISDERASQIRGSSGTGPNFAVPIQRSDLERYNKEIAKNIADSLDKPSQPKTEPTQQSPRQKEILEQRRNFAATQNIPTRREIQVGVPERALVSTKALENDRNLFRGLKSQLEELEKPRIEEPPQRSQTGFRRERVGPQLLLPEVSQSTEQERARGRRASQEKNRQDLLRTRLAENQRQRDLARSLRLNVDSERNQLSRRERLGNFLNQDVKSSRTLGRVGEAIGSSRGTTALLGASLAANTLAPGTGFANVLNATATGGFVGSLFGPQAAAIGAIGAAIVSLANEFDLLDKATGNVRKNLTDLFEALDTGILDARRDDLLSDIRRNLNIEKETIETRPNVSIGAGGPGGAPISTGSLVLGERVTSASIRGEGGIQGIANILRTTLQDIDGINETRETLLAFESLSRAVLKGQDDVSGLILDLGKNIQDPSERQTFNAAFQNLDPLELRAIFSSSEIFSEIFNNLETRLEKLIEQEKKLAQTRIDNINKEVQILNDRLSSVNSLAEIQGVRNRNNIAFQGQQNRFETDTGRQSILLNRRQEIEFKSQREAQNLRSTNDNRLENVDFDALNRRQALLEKSITALSNSANPQVAQAVFNRVGNVSSLDTDLKSVLDDRGIELEEKERKELVDTLVELQKIENDRKQKIEDILQEQDESLKTLEETKRLQLEEFRLQFEKNRILERELSELKLNDTRRQFRRNAASSEDLFQARNEDLNNRIASRGLQRGDTSEAFRNVIQRNFQRNDLDVFRQVTDGVDELAQTMRTGLTTALTDTILEAKSASDAFAGLGQTLSRIALQRSLDALFDSALSGISKNIGNSQGFQSGGLVQGGSGFKDDIPANLSAGEFVLRRSAVNRIGLANLQQLNQRQGFQDGGFARINLNNSTDFLGNPRKPSGFKINIDPGLSAFALRSELNRQNDIRNSKTQEVITFRQRQLQALEAFEKQKQSRRIGALISAVASVGSFAIGGGFSPNKGIGGGDFTGFGPLEQTNKGFTASRSGILRNSSTAFRNRGGTIGFESGGNVPAILTGGEFAINRQTASMMGLDRLNRLNSGQISSFQGGGTTSSIPSQENPTDRVVDAINELKMVIKESPTQQNQSNKGQFTQAPQINIEIPISIQSTTSAGRPSEERDNVVEEDDDRALAAEEFGKTIQTMINGEVERQIRPGGQIYNAIRQNR